MQTTQQSTLRERNRLVEVGGFALAFAKSSPMCSGIPVLLLVCPVLSLEATRCLQPCTTVSVASCSSSHHLRGISPPVAGVAPLYLDDPACSAVVAVAAWS